VLGYTADVRTEERVAGLRAGMSEVLAKPAGLFALDAAVASCLQAVAAASALARDGAA
jgi:DNA-binding response OmpR family regulator